MLARAILVARASSGAIARSEYVKSALYSRAAAAGAASASSPTERRLSKQGSGVSSAGWFIPSGKDVPSAEGQPSTDGATLQVLKRTSL